MSRPSDTSSQTVLLLNARVTEECAFTCLILNGLLSIVSKTASHALITRHIRTFSRISKNRDKTFNASLLSLFLNLASTLASVDRLFSKFDSSRVSRAANRLENKLEIWDKSASSLSSTLESELILGYASNEFRLLKKWLLWVLIALEFCLPSKDAYGF